MPKVPTTGVAKLSGDPNGIKECVIYTGGTPAADDIVSLRNAAKFKAFDPAFLDGATSLSQIDNFDQFRGYPKKNYNLTFGSFSSVMFSRSSGDVFLVTVTLKRVSNNSDIGEATYQFVSGGGGTSTTLSLGGQIRAAVCWLGFFGATDSDMQLSTWFLIDDAYIITNYGDYYARVSFKKNGTNITLASNPLVRPGNVSYANSSGISFVDAPFDSITYYDTDNAATSYYPDSGTNPYLLRTISGSTYDFIFNDFG